MELSAVGGSGVDGVSSSQPLERQPAGPCVYLRGGALEGLDHFQSVPLLAVSQGILGHGSL